MEPRIKLSEKLSFSRFESQRREEMKRIIWIGMVIAVTLLALISLTERQSMALDPVIKKKCEKLVDKSIKKIGKIKDKVRESLSEFLDLRVACQAGTIDSATCDKEAEKLILEVEKLTEKIDIQIEKFEIQVFDELPECGDELDELGVDDFNLM